ncbi:bromodomain-containing protein 4 [Senna tora]|uniref:Bromodomain-containing protein 4 n=1 Tax=Senna tora TaxID=362788 RepID=A0A834WJV7_9FABA|nr:bromodomain-containing protein 4 [Senna tora]
MNTTPFMDKQIMDLTQGSSQSKDFIDLMGHPKEEEEVDVEGEARRGGHHSIGGNGIKKEDIVPSYDFQPIRPLGTSSQSSNHDSTPNLGAVSRPWSSDSKSNTTTAMIRNYSSLDSLEPAKVIVEKDQNAFDATILSEIDRTMKKHMENLLHVLEGVSARLTQLESRTHHLENSMDDLKLFVGNNHGSTDGKMRQLENILREVQAGVHDLQDKQSVAEAQLQLAKLQVSKVDQQSETQTSVITDPMQHAASAPQQPQQQLATSFNLPPSIPAVPHPNAPPQPPQQGMPPPVQPPNQFPQNQMPSVPQREPYFQPPPQPHETPNQQYQLPLSQQPQAPPVPAPQQQYQQTPQPQYTQPALHPPQQQQPSPSPVNPPPQLPSSLGHHVEESSYVPPQNYPPNVRPPPSQPPSGPPPSQPFYGPHSHVFEPLSSRSGSGFSSGYSAPPGPAEPYHYGGSPQYAMAPPSGGNGYPQLPTARVLPHALPTASGTSGSSGSGGSGNRVPIDDVVDKVASMGFPRDHVRATVRKLTENGQSVDLNIVLDKLMNESDIQPRGWYGR